jgi:thymidylate synthase
MRIFQNFVELHSEVGRDLQEMGIRVQSESVQNISEVTDDYQMLEITGYSYKTLTINGWENFTNEEEQQWLHVELNERIATSWVNPGRAFVYRDSMWEPFLDKFDRFDYTYNERIRPSIQRILKELHDRPNTRQAVLPIFWPEDLRFMGGKLRIPCSLHYQFVLRNRELHTIYSMRSCDYFNHFKFDVVLAWKLGQYVADVTGVKMASLTHFIGSLHAFKKDADQSGIF